VPRCPLTADCSRLVKARTHRRRDPGTRDAARECDGRYAVAQRDGGRRGGDRAAYPPTGQPDRRPDAGGPPDAGTLRHSLAESIDDSGLALIFPREDGTVIDAAGQPVGAAGQATGVSGTGLAVATVRRASRTVAEVRYRAERAGAEQLLGKVTSPAPPFPGSRRDPSRTTDGQRLGTMRCRYRIACYERPRAQDTAAPEPDQIGGSSVSGDQEFLTEGDGVIGSRLRQPDSVRRSGPG
jgi:hypothetical protein